MHRVQYVFNQPHLRTKAHYIHHAQHEMKLLRNFLQGQKLLKSLKGSFNFSFQNEAECDCEEKNITQLAATCLMFS